MQLCGFPSRLGIAQQPTVQTDPGLIVPQPDAGLSVLPEVGSVTRIELEQLLDLLAGPHVLVLIEQRAGVVGTRGAVAGGPLYDCFQQQLGIVPQPACDADAPQQAHGLDVLAMLRQVYPQDALGMDKLPVSEQAGGLDDLRGQVAQRGEAIRDPGGVLFIPHSLDTGCAASASWRAGRR